MLIGDRGPPSFSRTASSVKSVLQEEEYTLRSVPGRFLWAHRREEQEVASRWLSAGWTRITGTMVAEPLRAWHHWISPRASLFESLRDRAVNRCTTEPQGIRWQTEGETCGGCDGASPCPPRRLEVTHHVFRMTRGTCRLGRMSAHERFMVRKYRGEVLPSASPVVLRVSGARARLCHGRALMWV